MISVPISVIQDSKLDIKSGRIENYIIKHFTINEIVESLAELLVQNEENQQKQVVISEEEMQTILSVFRVKGQRIINGQIIKETRGRPISNKK